MQELPLNGFYSGESRKLSDRRCINFVPTPSDNGALSSLSLMPTVGIKLTDDVSTYNPPQNRFTSQVYYYDLARTVIFTEGNVIYKSNAGTGSVFGQAPIPDFDGNEVDMRSARFASSFNDAVAIGGKPGAAGTDRVGIIISPANGGVWNGTMDFRALISVSSDVIDVAFLAGRFIYLDSDSTTNACYYSDIGGTDPNSLDFFTPDSSNEALLGGIEVINERLYLFSETLTTIWSPTSSTDLPFRQSGSIDVGCIAAGAKTKIGSSIYAVGRNKGGAVKVNRINVSGYQAISTRQIEYQLSRIELDRENESGRDTLRLFGFTEKGRDFLCVRFNDEDAEEEEGFTFVYDIEYNIWHERFTEGLDYWDCIGAARTDGEIGSTFFLSSTIDDLGGGDYRYYYGVSDDTLGTEFGRLVERTVITSPFNDNNDRMIVSEVQPMCETDYSTSVEDWYDSKINFAISYDFGNSFTQERTLSIGQSGNYTEETRFIGVGYVSQAFNVLLRVINPYPVRILKLLTRMTKGSF